MAPNAAALHLVFFDLAIGSIGLALGAPAGRPRASEVAAAVALVGWLINGFAPLDHSIYWLKKYLSPFRYYASSDPLTRGVDTGHLAVLGLITLGATAVAAATIERRDIRV